MIEINLLPGADRKKRRKKGGPAFSFKLPESMPAFDGILAFIVAAWIIGPLLGLWLFLGVRGDMADVDVALEQAVADSARFANVIATQVNLQARQDTIAEKLRIIQEIDAGRYIWPHIMDEVSRAVPPYTWLQALDQVSGGATPRFQVQGRTGSLPALTRFMDALEASPFLRNIQLVSSEQAQIGSDENNIVNNFVLTGAYEVPSMEMVETVPLFEDAQANSGNDGEASDGTGTS